MSCDFYSTISSKHCVNTISVHFVEHLNKGIKYDVYFQPDKATVVQPPPPKKNYEISPTNE